jgi:hypothetical protein
MSDTQSPAPKLANELPLKTAAPEKAQFFSPVHGLIEARSLRDAVAKVRARDAKAINTKDTVSDGR